ncbi:MAG: murein L,D-transpeptidase catalytic domain family protein [Bacteroidia bacterium]|nr:murein L,D-transpeptidase catalytic domain family protein [Bacteroidia bacterium]
MKKYLAILTSISCLIFCSLIIDSKTPPSNKTEFEKLSNCINNKSLKTPLHQPIADIKKNSIATISYKTKAKTSLTYCKNNSLNTSFCLLQDLSKHSGKFRIYVWDFNKNMATDSGLVSHGCDDLPWSGTDSKDSAVCSNVDGSHCSASGKYKIGSRGYSQWGIKINYLLHGLEASNKNALKRTIVLHSWDAVGDVEIYPEGTPEGWGCPAVSDAFLTRVDVLLKNTQKPVLLWVFNN